MFQRKRTGSTLCPSCGKLVGVADPECLNCGRKNPGMWGLTSFLHRFGQGSGFSTIIFVGTAFLFLATLMVDPTGIRMGGLFSFGSPSQEALLRFGATGIYPTFALGRWWTLLSAGWLHGGVLHIAFCLYWVRFLVPETAELYGIGRTVILYTFSSVFAFALSCVVPPFPFIGGSYVTIGASAPICGLLGALVYYGRRAGSRWVREQAWQMALSTIVMGFLLPGAINNLAHIGGFLGGFLGGKILDPLKPERGNHQAIALACLVATIASIVLSLVVPLP